MNNENTKNSNRDIIKIEISGAPNLGKTVVTALLAKAMAKVVEDLGMLTSIKVANLDGDYPLVAGDLDRILEDWKTAGKFNGLPERILFVELGSAEWSIPSNPPLTLEQIAVASNHRCTSLPPFAYLGPALIDKE